MKFLHLINVYLFGVDRSLVGNLSSACPESETPRYGRTFCMEKFAWHRALLSKHNPVVGVRPVSSVFWPFVAARFLAAPENRRKNLPVRSSVAIAGDCVV